MSLIGLKPLLIKEKNLSRNNYIPKPDKPPGGNLPLLR